MAWASWRWFLVLLPWTAFMAQAWPSTKGMASSGQGAGSPSPPCRHRQSADRPGAEAGAWVTKGGGGRGAVAVQDAEEQGPGVQVDAAVESRVAGWLEAAHGEGLRWGWCDGRRLGASSIIAGESLHEYPAVAPDRGGISGFHGSKF